MFVVASICFTLVHSFLLNLNDSHLGFGNDNQDHLSRRIDNFQSQIQLQIKTLESQSALIQQLLNYPISTLSSRYSTLSTLLQEIESRVITLEHNLEGELIISKLKIIQSQFLRQHPWILTTCIQVLKRRTFMCMRL